VPWESGKRLLFSIFSMASFCQLLIRLDDALLHLDLESAVPHPCDLLIEKKLAQRLETADPSLRAFSSPGGRARK
jgi:hypothetical protein